MSRGRLSITTVFLRQAANSCDVLAEWDALDSKTKDTLYKLSIQMKNLASHLKDTYGG